jgi:pimeloyl-ACP methyl ester carboxylesterase
MSSGRRTVTATRHLVLLPAMLCDEELYRPQAEALAAEANVATLVIAEAGMAESAAAVLRQAPPQFVLAGTSYGANLALEVAIAAPTRVVGLWLMGCNPGPHGDPEAGRRLSQRVAAGKFEDVVNELASAIVYAAGANGSAAGAAFVRMARRLGSDVFLNQNAALLARHDRRNSLASIQCPTLLVWGREDEFAGIAHADLMASRMPRASLTILDQCGHLPTLEQPAAVTDAVRTWLRADIWPST